jgi:hypothetical protein
VLRSADGVWRQDQATLTLTQGIAFSGSLDLSTGQLLQELDGVRTLREAVKEAARELGLSSSDQAVLSETGIAMARRLYQLGFLVRVSGGGPKTRAGRSA